MPAKDAFGFLMFVFRRWTEDRCPQIAGSLTYTTLLALVPVFAIAVAVLSSAPFFEDVMVQIKIFLLLNLLPELAGKIITEFMEEFAKNAARLTTVGVVALFVMAIMLMFTIDRSINAIWRVRRSRPYWVAALGYTALLVTGPLLIGLSMSLTTYVVSSVSVAEPFVFRAVPTTISATAFFLLYRIVPHRPVPWRHALVGGVVAAVLFEAAKELFAAYVRHAPTYSMVYGTFAAVPIFLIWVYISWLVVLFGAELTASLDFWSGRRWRRTGKFVVRVRDAVAVTERLAEARDGKLAFDRLRFDTGIPARTLEVTLERMTDCGLLAGDKDHGYRLARPPDDISLGELHRLVENCREDESTKG